MLHTLSLNQNHEFRRIYAKGRSAATPLVVLYCRRNGSGLNRYGITVGTKLGKAVVRNRIRRRLREIYRLHEAAFSAGWDIVAVARSRAVEADYAELEKYFLRAADRLGLMPKEAEAK